MPSSSHISICTKRRNSEKKKNSKAMNMFRWCSFLRIKLLHMTKQWSFIFKKQSLFIYYGWEKNYHSFYYQMFIHTYSFSWIHVTNVKDMLLICTFPFHLYEKSRRRNTWIYPKELCWGSGIMGNTVFSSSSTR